MKKWFICAALFAGAAMQAAPKSVDVKICSYQVVNDTVVNALSPMGLALTPNGDILAGFQDRGDIMPQCKSYIVRSTDGGKTWGAPEKVYQGSNDKIGVALTLHNAPDGSIFMTKTTVTHTAIPVRRYSASALLLLRHSDRSTARSLRRCRRWQLLRNLCLPLLPRSLKCPMEIGCCPVTEAPKAK